MASIAFPDNSKQIDLSDGTHYGYVKVTPQPGKPTLLLLHGYPSSSFGWHHQVKQSISAGYGVIAPDFLGYGDTSAPSDVAAYDHTKIAKQIAEILDAEKISTVIAIGHDWGAGFLSVFARMFTKRISLLIFICVGYGNSHEIMTDMNRLDAQLKQLFGRELFGYWQFHNKPEAASILDNADVGYLVSWERTALIFLKRQSAFN
jgi:soluble epoxide hydrolase/lipid-phosphate phosphatase